MFFRIADNKGFTLVESMFSAIIGLLMMGMIMVLYVGANNSMTVGLALAEINADARLVMDRIVRDTRWATELETTRTISETVYVTSDDELIIEIPSIDGSGDIIDDTYDYVVYMLDSDDASKLRRIVDPDNTSSRGSLDQIIAENISGFSMTDEDGTALSSVGNLAGVTGLKVALTVSKTPLQNKTVTQTINSDVNLRNN